MSARNAFDYYEEDRAWFRYEIHYAETSDLAALGALNDVLGNYEQAIYQSAWYYQDVREPERKIFLNWDWVDSRRPSMWSQSDEQGRHFSARGYYWVIVDVYWEPRDGREWGWRRQNVTPRFCSF